MQEILQHPWCSSEVPVDTILQFNEDYVAASTASQPTPEVGMQCCVMLAPRCATLRMLVWLLPAVHATRWLLGPCIAPPRIR